MKYILLFILSGCLLQACQEAVPPEPLADVEALHAGPAAVYTIARGQHQSTLTYKPVEAYALSFLARFDSSAIYTASNPLNQADINKLLGLADCGTHHHINSARFGWRWYKEQLQIFAYTYNNGERHSQYIGSAALGTYHHYYIGFEEDAYVFRLEDWEVKLPRACTGPAIGYKLFPYFGGDEAAPQDITLWVVEE